MVKIFRNPNGGFSADAQPPAEGERPDVKRAPVVANAKTKNNPAGCQGNYQTGFPGEPNIVNYNTWLQANGFQPSRQAKILYETARNIGCGARVRLWQQHLMQRRNNCIQNNFGIPCEQVYKDTYYGHPQCPDCFRDVDFVPITCRSANDCSKRNNGPASKCYNCTNPNTKDSACEPNPNTINEPPCGMPTPTPEPEEYICVERTADDPASVICLSVLGYCSTKNTADGTPIEQCIAELRAMQPGTSYPSREACEAGCTYQGLINPNNYYSFLMDRIDQTPTPTPIKS